MHVLDESATLLYKTFCNTTLVLILVHFIDDIYVFVLRTS